MNTFYQIVDKLINKLKLNGFNQVTYGSQDELSFTRQTSYPYAHIVFPNGMLNEKLTTLSFIIIVADKIDDMRGTYKEYGKDNSIDIQQDLLIRTQTTLKSMDRKFVNSYDSIPTGYEIRYDITFDTFKDLPNMVAGYIFDINLIVPNMIDDLVCSSEGIIGMSSRPYNYGTSGTSGTSGDRGARGMMGQQGFNGWDGTSGTSGLTQDLKPIYNRLDHLDCEVGDISYALKVILG